MHKKLLFLFVMLCTQLSIGQTYPHVYSGGTAGTASANPNFTLTDFSTCQTSASLDANGYNWAGWSGPNYAIEINGVTIASGQYGPQTIDLTPYIPVTSVKLRSSSGSSLWLNIDATVTINSPLATMPANGPTVSDANICDTAFPYTVMAGLNSGGVILKWYTAEQGGSPIFTAPVVNSVGTHIYWVSQADAAGCESRRMQITINATGAPTGTATQSFCDPTTKTLADLIVTGTALKWYADASTLIQLPTTTSLVNGITYYVSQTVSGCETTRSAITVGQFPTITQTPSQADVLCFGAATGSATVVASGGLAPYSYLWSDGQTAATATGLAAGDYDVTITDANSCTLQHSFTITEPASPLSITPNTNHVDVLCFGDATGSATVAVTGGTGAYTYLWSNGQTAATATGLAAGDYDVTITDANNCTLQYSFTIAEPAAPLSITPNTSQVDVLCFGTATGSATVAVTGGTGAYTYLWSNGQTAATAIGLAAGDYDVTITDANNCTLQHSFTITEPAAPLSITPNTNHVDVLCFGDATGSATVAVTGGTGAYTYLWSNGQTAATATGLAAGDYDVTITDANNCTLQHSFTIAEPAAPLSITPNTNHVDVLCFGDATGSATVAVTGGTGAYTYLWNNGQTTDTISELPAGDYDVTITDDNGCQITENFTITEPLAPLTQTSSQVDVLCFGDDTGTATVTVTDGTAPYTYLWNDGQTAATATGLVAGDYDVTITDDNGCQLVANFTINEPLTGLTQTASQVDVLCFGSATGSATVDVTGGTAPYTYLWNDGQTAAMATGLAAGDYDVTITDDNGCTLQHLFTIAEPTAPLSLTPNTTQVDVLCFGDASGSATVAVTGGTAPYTYLWNDGQTTQTITELVAGTYDVTITDDNGCILQHSFTIAEPGTPLTSSATHIDVLCYNALTGEATITATGGTGAYTYNWNSAPIQTTATATGLHAGTYIATVTDANGCTSSQTVVITQPTAAVQINAAKTNVTCSGNADGTITLTVSGGTGAYTYNWTPSVSTTNAATGLAPGNYVIAATDANGCTATITVNVTQPPVLTGSINVTNSDCAGFNNGTATVTVTGGTLPYTYAWSNGATTATAYGLNPGTYTVVVTDAHNCSFTGTVTSTEPPLITITAQPVDYTATVDGTAIFSVTAVNGWAYMWHVSKDNGTTWELVENGGFNPHYIGAQTNTLVISEITPAHNGYLYRARVFQIGTCLVYSDPAELNAEEVLGTEHFDNLHMTIYPNPASTEVYVTIPEFSSNKNVRFTMFDLNGRMVRDLNIETETSKFDVSGLESGVYIMNISSDKGSVVKKLVVDKKF